MANSTRGALGRAKPHYRLRFIADAKTGEPAAWFVELKVCDTVYASPLCIGSVAALTQAYRRHDPTYMRRFEREC